MATLVAAMDSTVPTVSFSTEAYSERDRSAAWREFLGRKLIRLEIEPLADRAFVSGGTVRLLPDLALHIGRCTGAHYRMTNELAENDDLGLVFSGVDLWRAEQFGREAKLTYGDAVLMSNGGTGDLVNASPHAPADRGPSPFWSLRIPRKALTRLVPHAEDCVAKPIPAATEALRLLIGYLRVIEQPPEISSFEAQLAVAIHIHDLVALAVGATRDAAEAASGRGLRAARLHAAKTVVSANLDDPDLSVTAVAKQLGVSPRYVQMLFESEGTTFSLHVLDQRLLRVHRMLGDPRFSALTITTLAFENGFGGLAHFNRAFRQRFGATPSDIRAQTRH